MKCLINPARRTATRLGGACVALALAWPLAASAQTAAQAPSGQAATQVRISTSVGDIVLELDAQRAPETVKNFVQYARDGHYDGTIFHRVIDGFMIQGGGFTPEMQQKPTRAPIVLESRNGLRNERGTIAMARTPVPNSATSQFFINVADNRMLDAPNPDGHGYAVFGRVTDGMAVVDRIRAVRTTTRGPHQNVPAEPILIKQVTLLEP